MRILVVHNKYTQQGGEDTVFESEKYLLNQKGHSIYEFTRSNKDLSARGPFEQAQSVIWNTRAYWEFAGVIRSFKPEIVHIHNFFAAISPSIIWAAKRENLPIIMTLHNYRLLCPNALFSRKNRTCEACLGRIPWPGVLHKCYRNSYSASGAVVAMLALHRLLGTWTQKVDIYIALTEFSQKKFIQGGLPADKIAVKPNFVHPDPGPGDGRGGFALFVGRLSPEKGLDTLLAAWERLQGRVPLKIVGDGPLASEVAATVGQLEGVEWLGRKPREEVLDLMKQASFLILPSKVYENFPMTIAEAFATGLPVIASNLGAMATLIDHERTGLHFQPEDPEDLVTKVEWLLTHKDALVRMRKEARAEYETKYTAERNYQMLMEIYARALSKRS